MSSRGSPAWTWTAACSTDSSSRATLSPRNAPSSETSPSCPMGRPGTPGALAGHVADGDHPVAVRRGHGVVEVAPDLVELAGGAVARRELDAGHLGQALGQELRLQGVGDLRPGRVEARVVEREPGPAPE